MKFVTWIEAILIVTLVAMATAAGGIAWEVAGRIRADDAPEEDAYARKYAIEAAERALARAIEESTRVHAKVVDARAEVLRREADVVAGVGDATIAAAVVRAARAHAASLTAYLARSDRIAGDLKVELARRRKAATNAFRDAKSAFDRNTRVYAFFAAAGAVAAVFLIAFAFLSDERVRKALRVHYGFVFGTVAAALLLLGVYALLREPGVIVVATVAVFVLVIAVARATALYQERG